jgi:hypothetical protein
MIAENNGRTPSSYIDTKIRENMSSLQGAPLESYVQAMYMSVKLNKRSTSPPPCSPFDIEKECGFNLKAQKNYDIIISKDEAIRFLEDFGVRITQTTFKKTYTADKIAEKLGRPVAKIGISPHCTYAEWLHLENFPFEPQLPQILVDLLSKEWKPPCP